MRTCIAAALAFLLQSSSVFALPQGNWPEEARNLPLGRPSWILVIPASRSEDGTIRLWDKQDEWLKSWIVPKKTPDGIRTVAITGDSEDQKLIHGEQLDNMRVDSLRVLARKYSAEAVAVVVRDSADDVAVAAWRSGSHATWDEAGPDVSEDPRGSALAVIDSLFSTVVTSPSDTDQEPRAGVRVLAERMSADGYRMEYRLESSPEAIPMLQSATSLQVTNILDDVVDVLVLDGRDISDILRDLGLLTE
jgi:Uncharacterized protein conserved in bacteria (DUF2066).